MASGEQIEQLLRDLGKAFSQMMLSSHEVVSVVKRLRSQGYDLSLAVEHPQIPDLKARIPLCQEKVAEKAPGATLKPSTAPATPSAPSPAKAGVSAGTFRIEGGDVALLRSLGIDATRKGRRKK